MEKWLEPNHKYTGFQTALKEASYDDFSVSKRNVGQVVELCSTWHVGEECREGEGR
jgi:hypothetical protein